ncbi:hypothetical protein BY996DRAFT_4595511 [Phakopsora pachyrhizi]|nr:hypothetical protein BY996DRAFT_4595511 [Phakopsora pachyrhizi]
MLFILLFLPTVLLSEVKLKRRCLFVDDNFQTKDCGFAPTVEELAQFFEKQAADLAELAITNPCGLTVCSKRFKRHLDFDYSTKKADMRVEKRNIEFKNQKTFR